MNITDRVVVRYLSKVAADLNPEGFAKELESHLRIEDRRISIQTKFSLGHNDSVYVNFINLPKGVGGAGGGAEAENNRSSFWIRGFSDDGPSPTGKVKIEMHNTTLPREYNLRAKSGPPAAVAKYLADFLNKVVKEVPPHFTHTKMP